MRKRRIATMTALIVALTPSHIQDLFVQTQIVFVRYHEQFLAKQQRNASTERTNVWNNMFTSCLSHFLRTLHTFKHHRRKKTECFASVVQILFVISTIAIYFFIFFTEIKKAHAHIKETKINWFIRYFLSSLHMQASLPASHYKGYKKR